MFKRTNNKHLSLLLTLFLCFSLIFTSYGNISFAEGGQLEFHVIDVGQADSLLIKLPNSKIMVIDGGNRDDKDVIINYLNSQGVSRIDYLVETHPHEDHIGSLDDVVNTYDIGEVYMPDKTATSQVYKDLIAALSNKGLTVNKAFAGVSIANETVNGKSLSIDMLSPNSESYSNTNDYSPVIKLVYGNIRLLLTGDAGEYSEAEILNTSANLDSDILKVGHHGSATSSSQAFLDAVKPVYSVIPVGTGNSYNHPTDDCLDRLKGVGSSIYRTDLQGTIVYITDGNGVSVNVSPWYQGSATLPSNPTDPVDPVDPIDPVDPVDPAVTGLYINEVLPAPQSAFSKEFVELFNSSSNSIDLSGYKIDDIDGGASPYTIPSGTTVAPGEFYVYEATSVFNNSGDSVRLLDGTGKVVDSFSYSSSSYDMSYFRTTDGGQWSSDMTDSPTKGTSNTGATAPVTTKNIVVNEVLPAPKTAYSNEFVELYNPNDQTIDISGYVIDDIDGGASPYTVPNGTIIEGKGFYVYYTSSVYNNSGDQVRLFNPNGELIDSYSYGSTGYDLSYSRIPNGGDWSQLTTTPTPGQSN